MDKLTPPATPKVITVPIPTQTIYVAPHPLSAKLLPARVGVGQTLRAICGPNPVQAWVNGTPVTPAYVASTPVPADAHVVVAPIPQGEETWRTIGIIGLIVAVMVAPAAAAGLTGLTGLTGFWAGVVEGALTAAFGAGILWGASALIPPPSLEAQESFNRLAALTGQRNRVGAFTAIPRLYGRMRYYPPIPMTAQPYTEVNGKDQYQRLLLCLGYGPLSIGGVEVGPGRPAITYNAGPANTALAGNPIKIGDTPITEYDEVAFQIGRPDQMTLYTNEVTEQTPGWSTDHADPGTGWNTDNKSFTQTSAANATELSIDIWGALFSVNDDGKTREARVEWKLEYRRHGSSGAWTVEKDPLTITSSKRETVRFGYRWQVPQGQYDVRLTRKRTYHAANQATANDMTWVALRTIRDTPAFTVPETIVMALRIRATDQL